VTLDPMSLLIHMHDHLKMSWVANLASEKRPHVEGADGEIVL
jgi:hypothetical protein